MRIVVEGQAGEVLDEVGASEATLASRLAEMACTYPQATLYVDGIQVEVQAPSAETTTPASLRDLQEHALASMWGAFEIHLRLAEQLREHDSALTAQHLANNQKLIEAATAQREDHRKALKEIGMMERTQTLLQFDQGMDRQRWMQGMPPPRSSRLVEAGRDALELAIGAIENGARQIAAGVKEGTHGKR